MTMNQTDNFELPVPLALELRGRDKCRRISTRYVMNSSIPTDALPLRFVVAMDVIGYLVVHIQQMRDGPGPVLPLAPGRRM